MARSFVLILGAMPMMAFGQSEPPIASDRPGFSDGSAIVLQGHFQLETGFFSTFVDGSTTSSLGDLVLRRGLNQDFELRLIGVTYGVAPGGLKGWLDPSIGFKYRFQRSTANRPELSLVAQTTVPIGPSPLRTDEWNPTVKLAWTKSLGSDSLGGNFVAARLGSGVDRFTQGAISLVYVKPISPKFALTGEAWGVDHINKSGPSAGYASLAGTYLLNNDCQLDLRIGSGFDQRRDGWFLQSGVSIRF